MKNKVLKMSKLKYEYFIKLSDKEKYVRYKELSDPDKQRVRVNKQMICGRTIGYIELTKYKRKKKKK